MVVVAIVVGGDGGVSGSLAGLRWGGGSEFVLPRESMCAIYDSKVDDIISKN